jgi:hypothetical protein
LGDIAGVELIADPRREGERWILRTRRKDGTSKELLYSDNARNRKEGIQKAQAMIQSWLQRGGLGSV